MRSMIPVFLIVFGALCQMGITASELRISEHLKPLEPYIGKTWVGELSEPGSEKKMTDVSRWELILNGQAVRVMHSLNDGEYGGETIIVWDSGEKRIRFFYFTTAGFHTTGHLTFDENRITSHEFVTGNQNGITEVKSVSEILEDGRMRGSSHYLKNGEWVPGHSVIYTEDNNAKVRFRE